jgi:RNA polymerase sigma-70 factor (ECF subfamily)
MTRQEATAFYRIHSVPVYNTALRILRDESDAAEVMQDTLLRYLSGGIRSQSPAQASAWLRTTCIRKAIDRLRSRKKDPVFLDADKLMDEEIPAADYDEGEAMPDMDRIRRAMEALPQPYSLVLNLSLIEGLSYGQIAEMTGQKEVTLRSICARGKQKLIKLLRNHE